MHKITFPCLFLIGLLGLNSYSFSSGILPKDQKAAQTLRALPLVFEPNAGQAEKDVRFVSHRPAAGVNFTSRSVELLVPGNPGQLNRLRMELPGNPGTKITGEDRQPGVSNYMKGNDRSQWRTGIANFGRIRYSQLYPGIDVVFYGNGENLEHDFIVAPGAKPEKIRFDLQGAQRLEVDKAGDLIVHLPGSILKFKRPFAYQESPAGRTLVAAQFRLHGSQIAFQLGPYDHARALTIDPVLVFSTFLSGTHSDQIFAVATDSTGNIYVTGATNSSNFPVVLPLQPACTGCAAFPFNTDAFIAKLNPTGTALIYSTFLGGRLSDSGHFIAVDAGGNAIIAGNTTSPDFPAVNPIGSASCCSNVYLFVASLSPTGASLNYSGIVGPLVQAAIFGVQQAPQSTLALVTVDAGGNAYVTSQTIFSSFPTTPGALATVPSTSLFATLIALKVSPAGSLVWSTAIPGNATPTPLPNFGAPGPNTFFPGSISVDGGGNAIITGSASSGLPTTPGVVGPTYAPHSTAVGTLQGFALKLNPIASALSYATYLPATDSAGAAAMDSLGNLYIGGATSSPSLPVSATALFKTQGCSSCQTGYLLKLSSAATSIALATYWPSSVEHLALDSSANVYISGAGDRTAIPEKNPMLSNGGGSYVSELSSDLSSLLFSSVLSSKFFTSAALAVPPSGKIILAGANQGFPSTPGSLEPSLPPGAIDTGSNPVISAIDPATPAPGVCLAPQFMTFNAAGQINATLQNCGNADLHITSITSGSPIFSGASNCPVALTPSSICTVTVTYSPPDRSFLTSTITIHDDAPSAQQIIQVQGPGIGSTISPLPSLIIFFDTLLGATFTNTFRVTNFSGQTMIISNFTATGDFHVSPNACPLALPPGGPVVPPFPGPQPGSCDIAVSFSPTVTGPRTGTLSFVDSVSGATHIVQLQGKGVTSQPAPAPIGTTFPSGGGVPLLLLGDNFTVNSVVTVDGLVRTSNFMSPTTLDLSNSSLSLSDFTTIGELDASVNTPAPGGGAASTKITIYAAATVDSSSNFSFPVTPSDLVYDPHSGFIYASLTRSLFFGAIAVELVAIDPVTGKAVKGFDLGRGATNTLAISDDGQFLYVGYDDLNSVAQITAATGKVNFVAPLGSDPLFGPLVAHALRVLPGQPHSWVVSLAPANSAAIFSPLAVRVFDDAVARPTAVLNGYDLGVFPGALAFAGSDTTTLYSADNTGIENSLYRFTIGPAGISLKDKTPGLGGADLDSDGLSLFLANGSVLDPVTLASKGSLTLPAGFTPRQVRVDGAVSRAFLIGDGTRAVTPLGAFAGGSILAFDTKTFAALGSLEIPEEHIDRLVRWGTNGLAFMDLKERSQEFPTELEITRSHLTGTSALVPSFRVGDGPNAAIVPTLTIKSGSPATFNLTAIASNGFTGPITFSCSSLPLFAACSFNPPTVTVGPGSAPVTVTITTVKATAAVRPPRGGSMILLATVLGAPLALVFASRRHRRALAALCALSLLAVLLVAGCGGGSGTTTPPPPPPPPPPGTTTPTGTYSIILTATSGGVSRNTVLKLVVL